MGNENTVQRFLDARFSRRRFLGATAAGGAALLTGGVGALLNTDTVAGSSFQFVEASIPQLQAAMSQASSRRTIWCWGISAVSRS